MSGGDDHPLPGDRVGRALAGLTQWSVRHAGPVVAATLVGALVLGAGMSQLFVDSHLTDWLSDSDPDKRAADRVLEKLPGVSTIEAVVLELDPQKAAPEGVTDVRDEKAIRAQEHLIQYLHREVPELTGGVGLSHLVKVIRVAANGNDDAYFDLPPETPQGSAEFQVHWNVLNTTLRSQVDLWTRNPDFQSLVIALQFEPEELDGPDAKRIAGEITKAMAGYRDQIAAGQVPARYDLWTQESYYNVGPMSGIHKFEGHLKADLPILVPVAVAVILAALWVGLRNPASAVIAIATLGIATVATIGLMGWLRYPFSVANVSLIPLIIGNGIDYSIHVLNEYSEERTRGRSLAESFRVVGERAGVAMVLATATSVIGILSIALSDSVALTQLAYSCSFALILVTLLSLTFIPAATALWGDRARAAFRPTNAMGRLYRIANRRKVVVVLVLAAASGTFYANTANLSYFTELTASNFPEGDEFRDAYLHITDRQLGSSDEILIIEGDITDPATIEYIYQLEQRLMERTELIRSRGHVNSLTVLLGAYEIVTNPENTAPAVLETGLGAILGDPQDPQGAADEDYPRAARPTDRATIEADIAAMQASVAWRPLVDFLVSKDGEMTIIDALVDARSVGSDFEDVRFIHDELRQVIQEAEPHRPDDVTVHLNGLTTGVYQYLDYSFYWMKVLMIVSAAAAALLVLLFTFSWRAVLAVVVPMGLTTVWWFGVIAYFDIEVAISLIVPIIFITSIGSDYAAHLAWNTLKTRDPEGVYRTTGKAILFSAITDFGAFFVFSFSYLTAPMADVALATALAILVIFVVTSLTVPLFFDPPKVGTRGKGRGAPTDGTGTPAPEAVTVRPPNA